MKLPTKYKSVLEVFTKEYEFKNNMFINKFFDDVYMNYETKQHTTKEAIIIKLFEEHKKYYTVTYTNCLKIFNQTVDEFQYILEQNALYHK